MKKTINEIECMFMGCDREVVVMTIDQRFCACKQHQNEWAKTIGLMGDSQ